ncbi:ABC transporter substrate-binding protein [Oceanospirillum maris]|uniref:ABC transporter substrate-binding protein n=1 Tax=Oceanospirillum maris TaxID=64977 RepID=UPI0004270A8C|nr:ABC transporter substrate-binding protein [Oceanospirillum maris]
MKALLTSLPLALALSVPLTAQAADDTSCGKVIIADMNWNTATLMAHIDQFVLQNAYGCTAELVPGDSVPTSTSMIEKGEPDIAPELWTNSSKAQLDQGVKEGRLLYAGKVLSEGGEEGFWVPKYMVDQYPELATIDGVRKHADLFDHPEYDDRSAFYGCPAGWVCQITAGHLFNALNLEDAGFEMVDPGSGAALTGSLAKAYDRKAPWFGYYWAPTPVMGKYPMVKVDFGTGVDLEHYRNCTTQADCTSPHVTQYPAAPVHSITTTDFAKKAPAAYQYIATRSFTNQQMSTLLAWMEDNQADGEYAMEHFMLTYPDIWQEWLPADRAENLKRAVDRL